MNGDLSAEKQAKVVEVLNYMLSPDGLRLLRYGIEGVDYKIENGSPVFLRNTPLAEDYPLVSDEGLNVLAIWDQDWQYENPLYDPYVLEVSRGALDYMIKNGISDEIFRDYGTDLNRLGAEYVNPWKLEDCALIAITSGNTAETWDALVDEAYANGLEAYLQACNDLYISKGIMPKKNGNTIFD